MPPSPQPGGLAGRLWRLARPAGMPLVLGLPATGYGFAHWEWAAPDPRPHELVVLLGAWWFLSAGTLWLNAALDRDDGEVLMGPRPEVVPHLARWGYAALAAAVVVSAPLGPVPAACVVGCALLAVAYSHPRLAWKGHAWLGPLVNVVGYGVLSPLAGWSLAGLPGTPRTVGTLALVVAWVLGTYFGAQAFQEAEDRARGYHTLVALRGPRVVIEATRAAFMVSYVGMVVFTLLGWYPRLLLVAAPLFFWFDAHLGWWVLHPEAGVSAARVMLRRATGMAVVVLLAASAAHVDAVLERRPPAGRDTAVRFGPPRERRFGKVLAPEPGAW
jgi:hypothetical protein